MNALSRYRESQTIIIEEYRNIFDIMASLEGKTNLDSHEQDKSTSPEDPSAKIVPIDDPVAVIQYPVLSIDDGKVKYSILHQ